MCYINIIYKVNIVFVREFIVEWREIVKLRSRVLRVLVEASSEETFVFVLGAEWRREF